MFQRTIDVIKHSLYVLFGLTIAGILFLIFGKELISEDLAESIGEITGIILIILMLLQLLSLIAREILKRPILSPGVRCFFERILCVLQPLHYAIGTLFVGLAATHLISNLFFDDIEWDLEVVSGIAYGVMIILTVIYGILAKIRNIIFINDHIFWAILSLIFLFIHLID